MSTARRGGRGAYILHNSASCNSSLSHKSVIVDTVAPETKMCKTEDSQMSWKSSDMVQGVDQLPAPWSIKRSRLIYLLSMLISTINMIALSRWLDFSPRQEQTRRKQTTFLTSPSLPRIVITDESFLLEDPSESTERGRQWQNMITDFAVMTPVARVANESLTGVGALNSSDDPNDGARANVSSSSLQSLPPPPKITEGCKLQRQVQPNCNKFHEIDLRQYIVSDDMRQTGDGSKRTAWRIVYQKSDPVVSNPSHGETQPSTSSMSFIQNNETVVIKTLRIPKKDFTQSIYEWQQVDAAALDSVSFSAHVTKIFGFCGMSSLNSYANLGNLIEMLRGFKNTAANTGKTRRTGLDSIKLLSLAVGVAKGVADVQEKASITMWAEDSRRRTVEPVQVVHRDIGPSNILVSKEEDGTMRVMLDDFNMAYMLKKTKGRTVSVANNGSSSALRGANLESLLSVCTYKEGFFCGEDGRRTDTRSPEECVNPKNLSQAVDTYTMGTIFFYILAGKRPYAFDDNVPGPADQHPSWYRERVVQRVVPVFPLDIESDNSAPIASLKKAVRDSMIWDYKDRPSARDIANYLEVELQKHVS